MKKVPPPIPYVPVKRGILNKSEVRRYAKFKAREWGIQAKRMTKSFLNACEEAALRSVTQLVISNCQHGKKTLR